MNATLSRSIPCFTGKDNIYDDETWSCSFGKTREVPSKMQAVSKDDVYFSKRELILAWTTVFFGNSVSF